MTSYVLEGQYNIPLEVNVSAINCAGTSENATQEVYEGINDVRAYS